MARPWFTLDRNNPAPIKTVTARVSVAHLLKLQPKPTEMKNGYNLHENIRVYIIYTLVYPRCIFRALQTLPLRRPKVVSRLKRGRKNSLFIKPVKITDNSEWRRERCSKLCKSQMLWKNVMILKFFCDFLSNCEIFIWKSKLRIFGLCMNDYIFYIMVPLDIDIKKYSTRVKRLRNTAWRLSHEMNYVARVARNIVLQVKY